MLDEWVEGRQESDEERLRSQPRDRRQHKTADHTIEHGAQGVHEHHPDDLLPVRAPSASRTPISPVRRVTM